MDNINWSTELFNQDIKAMNFMELADWLVACRNVVSKDNYDNYEDYISDVALFCEEWEYFYTLHEEEYEGKSVFRSEKFKKALLYARLKNRYKFKFNGKDFIEQLPVDTYENLTSSIFFKEQNTEITQTFNDTFQKIQEIISEEKGFKDRLYEVIKSGAVFNELEYTYRAFKNKNQIVASSYKEAIKLIEDTNHYILKTKVRPRIVTLKKSFSDFDISDTVYRDYMSSNKCEQEFDKKVFINLSFALCFNSTDAEKFLKFNGYSIRNRTRQFDIICEKSFRMGLGREYAIALIDKFNAELRSRYSVYKPIANITKIRKN